MNTITTTNKNTRKGVSGFPHGNESKKRMSAFKIKTTKDEVTSFSNNFSIPPSLKSLIQGAFYLIFLCRNFHCDLVQSDLTGSLT
jgi:hypothetical protein